MSKRKTLDDVIMDYAREVGTFTAWDLLLDTQVPGGYSRYSLNSIHSALSRLYRAWCLERVSQGVYRLRKKGGPPREPSPDFQEISAAEIDAIHKWRDFEENLNKAVRRKVKL